MTSIVTVNVTQTLAPAPETLQQSGAFISQGGTNTSPGTATLLTQLSSLTTLLQVAKAITSLTWSGSVVSVVTAVPHGFSTGDTLLLVIAGAVPTGYNGTVLATVTGASTFSYPLAANPGAETTPGTYLPNSAVELQQMANTFFAQGSAVSISILELGPGNATDGVAALTAYITANPNQSYTPGALGFFYSYLVPREWDANPAFLAMLAGFESTTSRTYFFVTTTLATWQVYTNLMKCVVAEIESPVIAAFPANALTAISWTSGLVTASTTTAHGVPAGSYFSIAGVTPAGYNGTFLALPGTGGTTLVYALAANPGSETVLGTVVASLYANPGIPSTEFSLAAFMWVTLNYNPSTTNKVTPAAFSFLFGVTPFPVRGNSALLATLKAAAIGIVGTGAEGGISNTIALWGMTLDGRDFTYWYSVDWVQINGDIAVANAVINGSNTPLNPLYYNQDGINRLQQVLASLMSNAVTFGLANGTVTLTSLFGPAFTTALDNGTFNGQIDVNAVPFVAYAAANPADYPIGKYAGLSIIYSPARGFISIVININVSDFVAP